MTVKELYKECKSLIDSGLGEKEVWISRDDEGNSYHALYFSFMTEQEQIDAVADMGMFDFEPDDVNNVVILG